MAGTKDVAPLVTVDPAESPVSGAVGYEIYKQVNLAQLQDEVAKATGLGSVTFTLTGPADSTQPVSSTNETTLWVLPASIDPGTLATTVADHVISPNWGIPEVLVNFNAALGKLQADPECTLTSDDTDALLRGVALQFAAILSANGSNPPPS